MLQPRYPSGVKVRVEEVDVRKAHVLHDAVALADGELGLGAEDGRGGGALHAEGLLRLRPGLEAVEVVRHQRRRRAYRRGALHGLRGEAQRHARVGRLKVLDGLLAVVLPPVVAPG